MRILITGGNGFVGRPLSKRLSKSHDVHVIDNGESAKSWNPEKIVVHNDDIRNYESLEQTISDVDPDIVFHLAAIHYIPECERMPDVALEANVIGTVNILRAVKEGTRMIFISSGAVYEPDDSPHKESSSIIGPRDIYGFSKLHGEDYVNYYRETKGIDTTIVRLFNVIGPGETNPHVLPELIAQLKKGKFVARLGNIHPQRDYIYIEDVVDGLIAIGFLEDSGQEGREILNLGTSTQYSVEQLVAKLSTVIGSEIQIDIDQLRVRQSDRPFLCADMTRTIKFTGWKPRFSIEEALEVTWRSPDLRVPNLVS